MGNQMNRQDENLRKPQPNQSQQAENQSRQNLQDGTKKARSDKDRDMGNQQNRQKPDQGAGTRH